MNTTQTPDPNYGSGEAGFVYSPTSGDGSFWDAITVYESGTTATSLPNATDATGQNPSAIYADFLSGPGNNCLSIDLIYSKGLFANSSGAFSSSTLDQRLAVFDSCLNGGQGEWGSGMQISATFLQNYVYTYSNGNGRPQAIVQTSHFADGSWHALIYNVQTQQYDDLYPNAPANESTGGGTNQPGAALFFAMLPNATTCPQQDQLGESGLRTTVAGGTDNGFGEIDALPTSQVLFNNGGGPCFPTAAGFSPPYYRVTRDVAGVSAQSANDSSFVISMGS
ncbi:MAG: hypothetical protein IAI50_16195 [Candidatus Eremiobacteraeota bacterium]|nr:hypothetical protein [Candidatus Eremiobacteraeota bacterium]